MTQAPADAASPLEVSVRASIEGVRNLQAEVAALRAKLDRAEAAAAMELARADQCSASLAQCEALRDHYMKRTVELEVCLTTMQGLLADALMRGKGERATPPIPRDLDAEAIGRKFGANARQEQED